MQEVQEGSGDAAMKHVLQKDEWGCVFATLAMLTGREYDEIKAEVRERFPADSKAGAEHGINYMDAWEWLSEAGYFWQQRYMYHYRSIPREDWPPAPWCELHYCEVVVTPTSPSSHAVVMLADGSVLDPLTTEPRRLTDYHKTNLVLGLVRL